MAVTEIPRLPLAHLRELRLELDTCLSLLQDDADLIMTQSGADTVITAGADQITLHNFTNPLTANDFLFA
jgi:hypothetical protein